MPTKPGAGGKPQAYGKGGKYTKSGGGFNPPNGADPEPRFKQRSATLLQRLGAVEMDNISARAGEGLRMAMDGATAPRIRISPDILALVVADGRFKTQHDTGTSNGMLSPRTRDLHEEIMFSAEQTRPVYGYVKPRSEGDTFRGQGQYGSMAVVLKPEVAARTTVTYGDSLDVSDPPAPVPFNEVANGQARRLGMAATGVYYGVSRPGYIEAQIHGPVTLDDIDYIEMPSVVNEWNPAKGHYDKVSIDDIRVRHPDLDIREVDEDLANAEHFSVLSVETLAARVL